MKKFLLTSFLLLSFLGTGIVSAQTTEEEGKCYFGELNGKEQSYVISEGVKQPVKYCVELVEPIAGVKTVSGNNGVGLFSNYIGIIYRYGASIIGIVCVLVIVISGIQISMGGANSEFVNQGKERIMQALLSLILLFASALILRTINPGFFNTDKVGPPTTLVPNMVYEVLV